MIIVDICITTSFKQLENVCLLAEVLAQRKMHRPPYNDRITDI
jgi:hypothetical protein